MFRRKIIITIAILSTIAIGSTTVLGLNGYFGGGAGTAITGDTLTRGLVGYWTFDESTGTTAFDSTDNNNDGTLTNMTPASDWTTGKVGGALDFDGVDDVVKMSSDPALEGFSAITLMAWIYPTSTGLDYRIISKSNGGSSDDYSLTHDASEELRFRVTAAGGELEFDTSGDQVPQNEWTHVTGVYDGADMFVYINGTKLSGSTSQNGTITDSNAELSIGGHANAGSRFFPGKIDEARVYNRAMSAGEIKFLYNRGGPVGHWRFDEGSGATAYDSIGLNDGTLTNMATSTAWVAGKFGTALDFDGSNDYVQVSDANSLDATGAVTLTAWVNPRTITATDQQDRVVQKLLSYALMLSTNTTVCDNSGPVGDVILRITIGSLSHEVCGGTVPLDEWSYIVGIYDGSTERVYVNGILGGTNSLTGSIDTNTNDFFIGNRNDATRPFDGLMDDVRIYDYARTPEEIRLDYNAGLATRFGGSPAEDVERGLVGHWTFEEGTATSTADVSNQSNDGVLTNGPTWTSVDRTATGVPTTAFGLGGGTLDFDGADDYVIAPDDDSLDVTDAITISAWIFPRGWGENNQGRIVDKSGSGGYIFQLVNNFNDFVVDGLMVQGFGGACNGSFACSNANAITLNTWQHVIFVYDGNGTGTFYVNGSLAGVDATLSDPTAGTSGLHIGNRSSDTARAFDGLIDDVRIYNRALSTSEISYLYNKAKPIAHWKFDEGSGTTTTFDSAGSNDGTLNGSMTESDWVQGKYGTALDFDGSDDYIQTTSADLKTLNDFTLGGWFKADATDHAHHIVWQGVSGANGWGNGQEMHLTIGGAIGAGNVDDVLSFMLGDSDGGDSTVLYLTTPFTDTANWNHAMVTVSDLSGTPTAELFLNGVSVDTDTGTTAGTPRTNWDTNLRIGRPGADSRYFDGFIDDVRIYNYARTPEQIRTDYNAGLAVKFGGSPNRDINRGLVGYWNFEEGAGQTTNDQTDEGNNGTLGATTTASSDDPFWTTGKPSTSIGGSTGGALDFERDNSEHVSIPDDGSLSSLDKFTVTAWVNIETINAGDQMTIISHAGVNSVREFEFGVQTDGTLFAALEPDSGVNPASTGVLGVGTWIHVSLVADITGSQVLYIDGVQDGTGTAVRTSHNSNIPLSIGARESSVSAGGITQWFDGKIDEVRIYNRALSASEVRYLYNKGKPIAHYKFDEGAGATAFDSQGSNDGTLTNMATSTAWVKGKYGTALEFDGDNDYVDLNTNFGFGKTTDFSMTAWFKIAAGTTPNDYQIIGRTNAGKTLQMGITSNSGNHGLFGAWGDSTKARFDDTDEILSESVWYHVAVTYSQSDTTSRIYLNGIQDDSRTTDPDEFSDSTEIHIGNRGGDNAEDFPGQIDDVRIYNYARSAEEILVDYNAGLSTHFK